MLQKAGKSIMLNWFWDNCTGESFVGKPFSIIFRYSEGTSVSSLLANKLTESQ